MAHIKGDVSENKVTQRKGRLPPNIANMPSNLNGFSYSLLHSSEWLYLSLMSPAFLFVG